MIDKQTILLHKTEKKGQPNKGDYIMKNRRLMISGLIASLLLSLAATAFAGMGITNHNQAVGTEAGKWKFNFDAPPTMADIAARDHHYDRERLALIGTEAGVDVIASCKARATAEIIEYNTDLLALIGTEAGQNSVGVHLDGGFQGFGSTMEHVVEQDPLEGEALYSC